MDKELKNLLNSKKFLYSLVLVASFFLTVCVVDLYNSFTEEEPYNFELKYDECPNFDGKQFLLSGGTKTLTNNEEIKQENQRLKLLCGGE